MTAVETEAGTLEKGAAIGQSVPRKEDSRLVQGQGVFFDDIKRHGMGYLHFVRVPVRPRARSSRSTSPPRSSSRRVRDADGRRGRDPDRPVLPDRGAARRPRQGLRARGRQGALHRRARRRGRRRDARARARRGRARRWSTTSRSTSSSTRARRSPTVRRFCTRSAAATCPTTGVWEWGDVDAAFAEADHIVSIKELHFDRFNSTPLECDGALVEYNRGTGQWTMYTNNQFPGFAAIMMGPAMRVGLDKLRIVTQDIGGGFGNKITTHPQLVVCCLLARKLKRPIQWTEWRTEFHQSMSHGNERWFQDTEVAVKADGTLLGLPHEGDRRRRRLPPLRAARRRDLGAGRARAVPLAKHPGRVHAGDDEQGARLAEPRLLAHAAPVVHRARDRHRRPGAELRPGRDPEEELHPAGADAVRDAERLRLRLRRLPALARSRARPDRLRADRRAAPRRRRRAASCWASASARRSTPARTTSASRS